MTYPTHRIIFIIGLRGSGKSTIGPKIATQFDMTFIDLDDLVRTEFKESTVREIWQTHGESAWRDAESRVLSEVLDSMVKSTGLAIALGGGAPMIPDVQQVMRQYVERSDACIIYLRCSPDLLQARLANEKNQDDRPPLTDSSKDAVAEVHEVFRRRDPTYTELATHIIDINDDQLIDDTIDRAAQSLS